jgi:hypothetical protein
MKYLVCYDGSDGAKRALLFTENAANVDKDEVVLFGVNKRNQPAFSVSDFSIPPSGAYDKWDGEK